MPLVSVPHLGFEVVQNPILKLPGAPAWCGAEEHVTVFAEDPDYSVLRRPGRRPRPALGQSLFGSSAPSSRPAPCKGRRFVMSLSGAPSGCCRRLPPQQLAEPTCLGSAHPLPGSMCLVTEGPVFPVYACTLRQHSTLKELHPHGH